MRPEPQMYSYIPTGIPPRTYFSRRAEQTPILDLLMASQGHYSLLMRWQQVEEFLRKAFCWIFGHRIVHQWWGNGEGRGEWHNGCARCPLFWTGQRTDEPPHESTPRVQLH